MASKTQLFLHIGHPKTASSTLQAFLFQNWQAIESAGYLMPTANFHVANGEVPPGNALWALQDIREKQDASPILHWIETCQKAAPEKKLVLSSECLMQPEWPALFQSVAKLIDIHLIYYVRRQDQLLLSAWRQWGLKRGLSLDDFLARRLKNLQPNFLQIVEGWTNKIAIRSHHIRFIQVPFLGGQTVIDDFCQYLGLEAGEYDHVENQNISVDARLALFLNKHTELFDSIHDEEIFTLLRAEETEPEMRLLFNQVQFERIRETFEPFNQQLLNAYQPDLHGTPVIDSQTARLGSMEDTANTEKQLAYVTKAIQKTAAPNHSKLTLLKQILQNEHGVSDV